MGKKQQRAIVIGTGGIGKFLLAALARYLAFDSQNEWSLTLVDGDEYEVKNQKRQAFSKIGNKAEVTAAELRELFPDLVIEAVGAYVTDASIVSHSDSENLTVNIAEVVGEGDWVFVCVDNHATRKLVSDHCQTLQNVRLISGGNDLTDGNVQIHIRRKGRDLTPPITTHHPEIATPQDKPPQALSCEELAVSGGEQLIFANQLAAALMCAAFYAELTRQLRGTEEIYFDLSAQVGSIVGPAARPVAR